MSENFHTRRFERSDMEGILEIERGAFPKTPYPEEIFRHYAAVFPKSFLVMSKGEEVIGYIIFDAGGHVISMAVKEGHRRQGYGKSLINHAQEQADSGLWLEVRTKNHVATAFYRSLGMKTAGKIPGYYGNDDALVMVMEEREKPGR